MEGARMPNPTMRRLAGRQPHPLLVDRLLYVQAGRDDAETERRIIAACVAEGVDIERAVACVAPAADLQNQPHGGDHVDSRPTRRGADGH